MDKERGEMNAPTPRTDAFDGISPYTQNATAGDYVRMTDFARQLERELAAKTEDAEHFFQLSGRYLERANKAEEELERVKKELASLEHGNPYKRVKAAEAEAEALRKDVERLRRLFQWAANELLACDYGDNDGIELVGKPQIGWRVHGWRHKDDNFKIYGESIEIAVQNQVDES